MTADGTPKPALAGVFKRDLAAIQPVLQQWFRDRMERPDAEVTQLAPTRNAGLSHELLSADVAWREAGKARSEGFILRLDPVRYRKRHTSALHREFLVQSILGKLGDVPVAPVHWYETDPRVFGCDFYAMQRLDGRTLPENPPWQLEGWVIDLAPDDRRTLWRNAISAMAKVHRTPIGAVAALRRADDGRSDLVQQLDHWRASYEWATSATDPEPIFEVGWRWLFDNIPEDAPPGLAWGDAHPRNIMFRGLACHAVLDWEDVALSSPVCDLGRWLLTDRLQAAWGRPLPPGVPAREEFISQWESQTGLSAASVRWFEVLNGCFAVGTMTRTGQLQRELLGETVSADAKGAETLKRMLGDLLEDA